MNEKRKMGERGNLGIAFVFLVTALFVILVFAFIMPMAQKLNLESYKAGEVITQEQINTAAGIQDQNVREAVLEIYQSQKDSFVAQIDVTSAFIQYGWFFVILIVLVGLFFITRRNVEAQGGVA